MGFSWFFSFSCSGPTPILDNQIAILEWLTYILFSPCSLAIIQPALHIIFFVVFSLCSVVSKNKVAAGFRPSGFAVVAGPLYFVTAGLVSLISLCCLLALVWQLSRTSASSLQLVDSSVQFLAWLVYAGAIIRQRFARAIHYPASLRAWWFFASAVSLLQFLGSVIRISASRGFSYSSSIAVSDVLNIVVFPVALILLYESISDSTGLSAVDSPAAEPLLNGEHSVLSHTQITGYHSANLFSRTLWLWLNPLLSKGYRETLQINDVPELSPHDRAEKLYNHFASYIPKDKSAHPCRSAVISAFKWDLAFNAMLALIKSIAMFIGPILIQYFVDFLESSPRYYTEGLMLVFILLVAKFVEVLSTHQYQFLSQKLGMMIRSCLITTIYNKGLVLSSSSRQSHGAGTIVNYMSVDVQQVNDSIVQINNVWTLPIQSVIALAILYQQIGIAMLAGFVTMIVIGIVIYSNSRTLRRCTLGLMSKKDVRMRSTTEALNYMKIIKLQAWEDYFEKRVDDCRKSEYSFLKKFHSVLAFNITVVTLSTSIVCIVTFGCSLLLNVQLTSTNVFTVVSVFNILAEPIRTFPQAIISIAQAIVSIGRIDNFMLSKELDDYVERESVFDNSENAISVENGQFTWDEEDSIPTLSGVNVQVPKGNLIAVVGTVGSGKSSLLAALLGEMPKLTGKVQVNGRTAYVPQSAWIQSGTLQDNILFGLPMDHARYRKTIKACSLEQDIAMLEFGDSTEIGERGINLSGGQKQRVQLARAVYQDADVYFLDDIFSALDAHTGSAIFKECLLGALSKKTRVLVTHQVEFLNKADLILVMQDGVVRQQGKYHELLVPGSEFSNLVKAHESAMLSMESLASPMEEGEAEILNRMWNSADNQQLKMLSQLSSGSLSGSQEQILRQTDSSIKNKDGKLVQDEERETGQVGWNVYWTYFTRAFGPFFPIVVALVQIIAQSFSLGSDFWLSHETSTTSFNPSQFMRVYALLNAGTWIFTIIRGILMAAFALGSSQRFFFDMLHSIFQAPMSFFDTTPTGRILTRSSTDQSNIDVIIPLFLVLSVVLYAATVGVVVVTCVVTWPIIFLLFPLGWTYYWYQAFYIKSSREITRLDSITKAPIIHNFTETISGFMVIRGFKKENEFRERNLRRVNTNLKMDFHFNASNEWIGFRLEMIGASVLCATALLLVLLPDSIITPALAALCLSYTLSLNTSLAASVFFSCMVENKMVSVERIGQFTRLPSEAPRLIEGSVPSKDWPTKGAINIRGLKVRYQPHMPLVIKGITANISAGQKIGVVGRTGSGKSTLVQVMFRIVEPAGGLITFDDVDISCVGLHQLRSRLGIIPQDPVLFEGTIRKNMDPLGEHTEQEIWEGLRKCQLADVVATRNDKLDAVVLDNGENWSLGQRQLLCLGRALLKRTRILFLDEATASVDAQTDAVLQKVIREEFKSCTVVSIAHRIPTVMDGDKVMVLEAGLLKEYDSPAKLLENPTTLFAALVREYTERSQC